MLVNEVENDALKVVYQHEGNDPREQAEQRILQFLAEAFPDQSYFGRPEPHNPFFAGLPMSLEQQCTWAQNLTRSEDAFAAKAMLTEWAWILCALLNCAFESSSLTRDGKPSDESALFRAKDILGSALELKMILIRRFLYRLKAPSESEVLDLCLRAMNAGEAFASLLKKHRELFRIVVFVQSRE